MHRALEHDQFVRTKTTLKGLKTSDHILGAQYHFESVQFEGHILCQFPPQRIYTLDHKFTQSNKVHFYKNFTTKIC